MTRIEAYKADKSSTETVATTVVAAAPNPPANVTASGALLEIPTQAPPAVRPAPSPEQEAAVLKGAAPFEGPDNAIEVNLPARPIAEPRKERRKQAATPRSREIVADSRDVERQPGTTYRVVRETRDDDGYSVDRGMTVTRTYQARSRGFGGLLFGTDDD